MELKGVVVVEDCPSQTGRLDPRWPEATEYVANKPIIYHVLEVLESVGVKEVVVVAPHDCSCRIRQCLETREPGAGAHLRYVEQRASLDLGRALEAVAPLISGAPCIVHLATGLLGEPLGPLVDRLRSDSPDVIVTVHNGPGPVRHLSTATKEMLHLAELRPEQPVLSMAGICLFGPGALLGASTATWRAGKDVDLTFVAERIAAGGGSFEVLPVSAWRRYAGDPLDLLELNRIALDRLETEVDSPTNNGNRIEGRVSIHEDASVRASVIVGPAIIGAGAQISDAYIGPYTSIGAGAWIEGAEVERSIIAAGASIIHVGGRLVASVVGRDARIFRDFSLPRAMRLRVGDGTEVALC